MHAPGAIGCDWAIGFVDVDEGTQVEAEPKEEGVDDDGGGGVAVEHQGLTDVVEASDAGALNEGAPKASDATIEVDDV